MEDFRTFIAVDSNFNLEHTIAENHTLKYNNKLLITAGVAVGMYLIGLAIYCLKEEKKEQSVLKSFLKNDYKKTIY